MGGLLLAGAGCATGGSGGGVTTMVAEAEYVLERGNHIRVRVWPDSSLGGTFPVEDDGNVYLPVIGTLPVAGKTLSTLRAELRSRYSQEMRNPTISVSPLFNVSVLGGVLRPGLYQVGPTHTIFDAISMAGGFSDTAKEDEVAIVRNGVRYEIDAEQAMKAGTPDLLMALKSGDRIVVPEGWDIQARDVLNALQAVLVVVTLVTRF